MVATVKLLKLFSRVSCAGEVSVPLIGVFRYGNNALSILSVSMFVLVVVVVLAGGGGGG